jgi:uncharacterized protein (TIGR02172 family)
MKSVWKDDEVTLSLTGRIDSNNAPTVEAEIQEILAEGNAGNLILDLDELEYISSAGLRTILRLRKNYPNLKVINASADVYAIFEMTGFTEMMEVTKANRKVEIEGCEVIGRGANGSIYRIDRDNVVKVYNNADALAEIEHEREVARLALILGIPTAIPYDVVRVGDSYGSVFELLNAESFSKILANQSDRMNWCVEEAAEILRRLHSTEVPEGKLPDMKAVALGWAEFMRDYLPEEEGDKLVRLISEIPDDNHMIHGDYHSKNLELTNDEVLLIDMDTLAVGHPIFELASMFNAYAGFYELDRASIKDFQGFDYETASEFWHKLLREYLGTTDEDVIKDVEDKARIIGYTRLIRRSIRRNGLEIAEKKAEIDHWTKELMDLLRAKDSLTFERTMEATANYKEIEVEATPQNLTKVMGFIEENLDAVGAGMKAQMQIAVAVEELYINIAKYAYKNQGTPGMAKVRFEVKDDPARAYITFIDNGVYYDPLAKADPDVTLSAEERPIGGLGIFMVKKSMDDVLYEYKDGCNILTIVKAI